MRFTALLKINILTENIFAVHRKNKEKFGEADHLIDPQKSNRKQISYYINKLDVLQEFDEYLHINSRQVSLDNNIYYLTDR